MSNKLWLDLQSQGVVEGEKPKSTIKAPWYILAMLVFAGLVASYFLVFFILEQLGSQHFNSYGAIGVVCIISAYFSLNSKNIFLLSFGFSLSFLGQKLIWIYLDYLGFNIDWLTLIIAIFQLILLLIMPTFLHKVVSTFLLVLALGSFLYALFESINIINVYMLFIMALAAWFWVNEFNFSKKIEFFQAIAYGLIIFLIGVKFFDVFAYDQFSNEYGSNAGNIKSITDMLSGIVLCYIVWQLFEKAKKPNLSFKIGALIIAILIGVLSVKINGLTVGIMIIVLGFSASNLVITGLGIISLLAFISHYYYSLDITLLEKSIYLFVVGVLLIFVRRLLLSKRKFFGVSNV